MIAEVIGPATFIAGVLLGIVLAALVVTLVDDKEKP